MKNKTTKAVALLLSVSMIVCTTDLPAHAGELGNAVLMEQDTVSGNEEITVSENQTEENENNGWDGVTTESTYETEDYKITFRLNSHWEGGYNAAIKIENTSDSLMDDWYLRFPLENQISNIWNAEIQEQSEGIYTIKNAGWNQDIPAGGSCEFGFGGNENFAGFPKTYEILGIRTESNNNEYEINYNVTSDWGTGFNGNVTIKNLTEEPIEDWQINFDFENEISNLWNGEIISHEGTKYVVKNAGWNQNIPAGAEVSFGFTVGNGNSENQITNAKLEQISIETEENISITIDTSGMEKNEALDCYYVTEKMDALAGKLTDETNVKVLSYTVKDMDDKVVCNGNIAIEENWKVNDIGLVMGTNKVSICAKSRQGKTYEESIVIMNSSVENMDGTNVDKEDTDGDGINNYFESILGTDKDKEDTDGDEINDYDEFTITGTDPVTPDTDENGIWDGKEDFDKDGLNNLEELTHKTNPYDEDWDKDGLIDGEEIKKYHTKPMDEDTDDDGLKDGEEISLGLNPLERDSDEDGVPDNQEMIKQACRITVSGGDDAVKSIEVEMTCSGYLKNQLSIQSVEGKDILSTNVAGLVGVPFEIKTKTPFDKALITVTYNRDNLGDSQEENLCLAWYNEETKEYELLEEETMLDKEKSTLSCYTDHFSTWLVIDAEKWKNRWEAYLEISKSTHDNKYETLSYEIDGVTHRYQLFEKYGSWQDAEEVCRMAGGYLATIQSEEENQAVYQYIRSQGCVSAYIGLTDEKAEGKWTWSNGEEVNYTKWYPGEPNGSRRENYAMFYYKYLNGHWNDGSFNIGNTQNDVSIFVCEWEEVENKEDSDKDGIPDYYEINGMILANGEIIYSDPGSEDTDGDDLTDYEEMFGEPKKKSIIVGGNEYKVPVWNMVSNPNLPDSDEDEVGDWQDDKPLVQAPNWECFVVTENNIYDNISLVEDYKEKYTKNSDETHGIGQYSLTEKMDIYTRYNYANSLANIFINLEAGRALKRYLDNTGKEYQFNTIEMQTYALTTQRGTNVCENELIRAYQFAENILKDGESVTIVSRNSFTSYENEIDGLWEYLNINNVNWFVTVGEASGALSAEITRSENRYMITCRLVIYDCYDWEKNDDRELVPGLPNYKMWEMHDLGIAKSYVNFGEVYYADIISTN